ncbi:hypothetical protein [Mycobacterium avium]|uniref:hypothetical protein n=1 Tax=Mycobacterium avium TaxID=1764 RepID=UPI00111BE916|nr:hypothetical protein [Mycobacterium avium]
MSIYLENDDEDLTEAAKRKGFHDEVVPFTNPAGVKTVGLFMCIPENAPWEVREGITRRREFAMTGWCPCGAKMPRSVWASKKGAVSRPVVRHADDCPSPDEALFPAIRRWLRS